jgi:hypothetical protein
MKRTIVLVLGWIFLARNQYCPVCGSEFPKGRKRKQKNQTKIQATKGKGYRKTVTISVLATLILVSAAIPAIYVPLTHRAEYTGEIKLITISIDNTKPGYDELHLMMEVVNGRVNIDKLHLHSYDRQLRYQSMTVKQDYGTGYFLFKTFMLEKGQLEDLNHGFALLIDYRYGRQWVKYFFG